MSVRFLDPEPARFRSLSIAQKHCSIQQVPMTLRVSLSELCAMKSCASSG